MKRLLLALVLCAATALPALAQVPGGSISGTVKDQQGGVLPGAAVSAQGLDATMTIATIGDGTFHFLDLAPGPYKITAVLTGFATVTRENIIVAVGRSVDVPLTLGVAGSETIEVTAASPVVDPTVVGTATNFTHDEMANIPSSRDPFAMIRQVPGVLLDQVNVGGSLTGTQPLIMAKGTRQQDTTWTLDGVEITDMGAPGQSPTYFNFDNFEEIQVSTGGNDIRARTGGAALNFIVKRGTNQFHGGARGYFSNNSMEASNVPIELQNLATPVTPGTADHTQQLYDWGADIGGPIWKDRAWFYASYSKQNMRIFTRSTKAADQTTLKDPNVKVNVQATKRDLINLLYFNGYKIKDGRANALNGTTFSTFEATLHQDNAYTSNPLHGLFKVGDDHVFGSNMFVSAIYSYYNTGIQLTPEGGVSTQAGRNADTSTSYGSSAQTLQVRPQHFFEASANNFLHVFGLSHNLKYGGGYRYVRAQTEVQFPGNGILAIQQTGTTASTSNRAQVFRQGKGANEVKYLDFFVGDTISLNRVTIDAGVRYDRQYGNALASTTLSNPGLPSVVPGIIFAGYNKPFTWKNFSPRVGFSYAIDASGKTVARVSFSRFAGQLAPSTVGQLNPTTGSTPGNATYKWTDLNGDGFATPDEVDLTTVITAGANGFNAANPTAVTSPNGLDPNLKAPVTQSVVLGIEREVISNLALQVNYTYNRTSNLFGNLNSNITPRVGVLFSDYTAGPVITGTLPDGSTYSVPTFVANPTEFTAAAGGFLVTNVPGYHTDYKGVELSLVKRLSNRWMGRLAVSLDSTTEHFDDPKGKYDTNGNPTPTVTEPLQDGGQFAPTPSASGGIYLNARWQFNANGMYQAPFGIDVSANIFGRQGYPFPIYRGSVPLVPTSETLSVLVSPKIDTFRLPNVWDTDIRVGRSFTLSGAHPVSVRVTGDVFNLFNANTSLARVNMISSGAAGTPNSAFNTIISNMSPRLVKLGLTVGF